MRQLQKESGRKLTKQEIREDYDSFVEKFKPKKTTDDCYTPPEVYEAVINWVDGNIRKLDGLTIRRPFKPRGDYQAESATYGEADVVIDNPPFSIMSQIIDYYAERDIPFFLFAPGLTLFSKPRKGCTYIVAGCTIVYENGAQVNTSFVTNMEGRHRVIVAGDLCKLINSVCDRLRSREVRTVTKRSYPMEVISAALLNKIAVRGITFKVPMEEAQFIRRLDNQTGSLFGGGYLISERAAAERAAAERAVLSYREWEIVRSLSSKG